MPTTNNLDNDVLVTQNTAEKEASTRFKDRRFTQWNENYTLFRDKVSINRLTQRQAVNIPIIRETIQSWISKIDEPPIVKFESRDRSNKAKDGEIALNTLWEYNRERLSLDILDNMDKKIVGLQGRSFKKWGFSKGEVFCDLIDPYDVDIDPRANPLDLDKTADHVIIKNIFRPLRTILANDKFLPEGKKILKEYLDSKVGIIASGVAAQDAADKRERLELLGVGNYDEFKASDVIVELNESYKNIWVEEEKRFVRHLIVIAADHVVLYKQPLKKAIGIDRLPIVTWASDPDLNDLWSDGVADNVRTINKVVNSYISQDLENRTYRNFGMYFFNTMKGTFSPRAFSPAPFGMYGVPGNPAEIVQQMRIEPLNDTAGQITFLKDLIQSSVAQTPTERGIQTDKNATLGEVQLQFQQSQSRNEVTAKNYRQAWKQSGVIFYELLNANSKGAITLYKKGNDGDYRSKSITPTDWQSTEGYECKVILKAEQDANSDFDLKKLAYIKNSFADNPIAVKLAKKKELELLDWSQSDIDAVMQAYEQTPTPMAPAEGVDPNKPQPVLSPMQPIQPPTRNKIQ
jgi:hypothetical protein